MRPEPQRLILASASPQRRAILAEAGIAFAARPADVEEATAGEPAAVAEANARLKAAAIRTHPPSLVLGADTIVALDGDILGKPRDAAQARAYLGRLNGRTHEVVGGIALARDGRVFATAVETTRVTFHSLPGDALDAYVELGEWRGRAGAYAIQERGGELLVARVDGDYLNVVGLPLARLQELLR